MEPVKGGSLSFLPDDLAASLKAERPDSSISSWALRWVASKPNVKVVLSGMSTMDQVEDNLHTFDKFEPLTEKETNLIAKTADNIKKERKMDVQAVLIACLVLLEWIFPKTSTFGMSFPCMAIRKKQNRRFSTI